MGYSCTAAALRTLQTVKALHGADLEENNMIRTHKGRLVFFEAGEEQDDGAIVGTVTDLRGLNAGVFRVEPDGSIARFAGLTKNQQAWAVATSRNPKFRARWHGGVV
jgi:hypothetical protein